jgi:hypothetical protein
LYIVFIRLFYWVTKVLSIFLISNINSEIYAFCLMYLIIQYFQNGVLWSVPGMKDLFYRLKIRLLGFEENKQVIEEVSCFVQEQFHIIIL